MSSDGSNEMVDRVFGDRYRVIGLIGVGALSQVFVADDLTEPRRVALKVFDQTLGEDPDLADRVVASVAAAARIEHPNIVPVHNWGLDGVRLWVVSELCTGGSLRAVLDQGRQLTPSQALVMSLEMARGLAQAHVHGLIHRSLRPENVLFSSDQRLRISDFGLAHALAGVPLTRPASALDLVRYNSPEQAAGRTVGAATDVYSLALVANEAVTGSPPPSAKTVAGTMQARSDAPATLGPELSELRGPLERAGRLDPTERPEADELTIALLAAAETMSRPGPLPLAGVPQASRIEAVPDVDREAPEADIPPLDEDGADTATSPSADAAGSGEDADGSADRAPLAAVPDVPQPTERLALEDLDLAEPTFADREADLAALDVPVAPSPRSRGVFRPDVDELDDTLPLWPLALLAALLAAAILVAVLLSRGTSGIRHAPSVVGLDEAELAAAVGDGTWQVERLEVRRNGTTAGTVIAQQPAADAELDEGEPLIVTISLGAEMVEIPNDLPGITLDQARERLRVVGLEVGVVTREPNESLDEGLVIGLDEPTRQKPQGEAVAVRVSTGPEDRAVPDSLIGTSIADATAVLAGLRLQGLEEQVYDPVAEPGTVLGTVPSAGESVPADSQVTLLVSAGPEPVEMPDLAGLSLAEAVDALAELGLNFADTEGTPGEPVVATIPPVGEIVDVGSEITIVLDEPSEDDDEDADADDG